ncbi:MAG: ArnT family glycosyltransferase [Nitrospira sp.]
MNLSDHPIFKKPRMIILFAIVVGLFARIVTIWHAPGHAFAVDQLFDTLAWNLVTLHQFTLDGVNPAAHAGPLYPAVLACFYSVVGHHPEWVSLLHVAFDLGTTWAIYRVATVLWGSTVGAWTASLVFLYPAYWTYDPRIRSEALFTLLISGWLWATIMCRQDPSFRRYAFMGLMAGFTILCKPVVLILAALVAGFIWIGPEGAVKNIGYTMIYGATCLALVGPWSTRNYVVFHTIIPVSAGVGVGLWMGSDPASRGSWPMSAEQELAIWDTAGITPLPYAHAMYEVKTDRLLREKGMRRIAADPLSYLGLTFTRTWDFWVGNSFYLSGDENGLVSGLRRDAADRGWTVTIYSLAKRLLLVPSLILVAACSAWVYRNRWRDLLPLYLFPLGLTAGYVPFTVEAGRYALPVLPCLMMLSVAAVSYWHNARLMLEHRQAVPQTMSA